MFWLRNMKIDFLMTFSYLVGHNARYPVFGFSNQVRLKPVGLAIWLARIFEIVYETNLVKDII